MTRIVKDLKQLTKNKKIYLLLVISFFAFVLVYGIQSAQAYYNDTASLKILANLVGDFENNKGDINMIFYKENDQGNYVRTYAVPSYGYTFNDSKTLCTMSCDTNETSECYYKYDENTKNISLTSNQKVMCKFYFDKENESDIKVYILKEDVNGTFSYNAKKYSLVESIPAYGYENVHSYCTNGSPIEYDSNKKIFSVSTSYRDVCYGYFDEIGNPDLGVNVYVQASNGSSTYKLVDSIPSNNEYVLSTYKNSYCYDKAGNTNTAIRYENGYINIETNKKQTCNVYLDLVK